MGNCQAIDAASLIIQHPNGKVDNMYCPIIAKEVMKMNPGHYVALLITTTICHSTTSSKTENTIPEKSNNITTRNSVRITRVKLLRPTDTLALGHVYRLISSQEVMKGMVAKKQAKMRKNGIELADSEGLKEAEKLVKKSLQDKTHQVSKNGHRARTTSSSNGGTRPKSWQPSLNSISEFAS
ncbi:hypothetical protein KSS87_023779 [Heliosperma pusillum]|nr:hypothetical protein KSS87_023779 [Heliosperma pusillum]